MWNIPAHAGKTFEAEKLDIIHGEHPRARGENTTPTEYFTAEQGTSPRTRGKRPQLEL